MAPSSNYVPLPDYPLHLLFFLLSFLPLSFETTICLVAPVGLKLSVPLPQPPESQMTDIGNPSPFRHCLESLSRWVRTLGLSLPLVFCCHGLLIHCPRVDVIDGATQVFIHTSRPKDMSSFFLSISPQSHLGEISCYRWLSMQEALVPWPEVHEPGVAVPPVIPAIRRWMQEDQTTKVILNYTANSKTSWTT